MESCLAEVVSTGKKSAVNAETLKCGGLSFLLLALLGAASSPVAADTDVKFSDIVQSVKVSGDLRLRYDAQYFRDDAPTKVDRERYRERLRIATEFGLPDNAFVKLRFASGSGEAISRNQTFGNLEQPKPIWIDQAFLQWSPADPFTLMAGKMQMPLWWIQTSKAIWDDNVTPEGAAEQFKLKLGETNKLFFNAQQMVANEISGSTRDQYTLSEQIGAQVGLPLESKFTIAYAYHDWRRADIAPFGEVTVQDGNRRLANRLLNPFGVNELTGELASAVGGLPLAVQGTWMNNSRVKDKNPTNGQPWEKEDTGYKVGAAYGKASKAHTWALSYYYQYVEADATVASLADSDFGPGGTNRQGHIIGGAYALTDWMTLGATWTMTDPIDRTLTTNGSVNRLFVDSIIKF